MPLDAEALVLALLRDRPTLAGYRFGTQRPADLVDRLPFVLVERTGGAARHRSWRPGAAVVRAGLALQLWATPDRHAARTALLDVLAELYAARGVSTPAGVLVRVIESAGPAALPDAAVPPDVHRCAASVLLTAR